MLVAAATTILGLGVAAFGWRQGQPDEMVGGVAILIFVRFLAVWATTADTAAEVAPWGTTTLSGEPGRSARS